MSATIVGRGQEITLSLRNCDLRPQDGYDVRWTVYAKDGSLASGLRLPASKVGTGEYLAPWGCGRNGECYTVEWEYSEAPGYPRSSVRQDVYVLKSGLCCAVCISSSRAPDDPGCGVFYLGQSLCPGDMTLTVRDDDGVPVQAFLVLYSVYDSCGRLIQGQAQASPGSAVGEYYAPWTVSGVGNMSMKWEWMTDSDSAMQASCVCFSALYPPTLLSACEGPVPNFRNCPPSSPSQVTVVKCYDDAPSMPRTVVLVEQQLPAGGAFTSQAPTVIPSGIRRITFYVRYQRGVPGGFPVVRLMWGNGTEETQSSVINGTFASIDSAYATNQVRLNDLIGPTPSSDDPVLFMIESSVPGGSTTARLLIAEGGMVGVPGTAEISITGS